MATADLKTQTTKTAPSASLEAVALLRADHKRFSEMFDEYEATHSKARKKRIVAELCVELAVHAQIEEEIFYPAIQPALKDKMMIPEATVEHASLQALMDQVAGMEPDGEMFDAKVKVLSEFFHHHIKEEQAEMFPQAKASAVDLKALGEQMAARRAELLAERG